VESGRSLAREPCKAGLHAALTTVTQRSDAMTIDTSPALAAKRPIPFGQRIAFSLMFALTFGDLMTFYFSRHVPSPLGHQIALIAGAVFGLWVPGARAMAR
jgi:hypothetical protein